MKKYNCYNIRVKPEDDLILDKLSYLLKKSKAELIRVGIKKTIEEHKNILQRSDIVVP